jgi:hypothetical protein
MRTPVNEFVYRYGGTFVRLDGLPYYVRGHADPELEEYDDDGEPIDGGNIIVLESPVGSNYVHRVERVDFNEVDTTNPLPGYYYVPEDGAIVQVSYSPGRRWKRGFTLDDVQNLSGMYNGQYNMLKAVWNFVPSPHVPSRELCILGRKLYMYATNIGVVEDNVVKFSGRVKREMRTYLKEVLHANGYKAVWNNSRRP